MEIQCFPCCEAVAQQAGWDIELSIGMGSGRFRIARAHVLLILLCNFTAFPVAGHT